jgi:CheY-like chemotaxis protein
MKFCLDGNIRVAMTSEDGDVILEIIDAGIGFDQVQLADLFKPFIKLDRYSQGAGLGLHITRGLVDKLGGKLEIRSTKGEGTRFIARLPAGLTRTTSQRRLRKDFFPRQSRPSMPRIITPVPAAAKRVLVVDDNAICRKLLLMTLKKAPRAIESLEAADGAQALEMFKTWEPDLVFTDVSMPVMNGIDSAGKMREAENGGEGKRAKIYAITALGLTDGRMKWVGLTGEAALDGWLVKGKDLSKSVYSILEAL